MKIAAHENQLVVVALSRQQGQLEHRFLPCHRVGDAGLHIVDGEFLLRLGDAGGILEVLDPAGEQLAVS